jgi:hypothetical protein
MSNPHAPIFHPIALLDNVTMKGREVIPMLNHNSINANPMADVDPVSKSQHSAEVQTKIAPDEAQLFRTLSQKRDVAPIAYMPKALAANPNARNLRRVLTHEQGRALEMIGHAVDYLNDCYLYEGEDDELINIGGSSSEAIQILASLRWQILQSAPIREPRTLRLWNALFHRRTNERPGVVFHRAGDLQSQSKPVSVLPLSSSR